MISSQRPWPLDHEVGQKFFNIRIRMFSKIVASDNPKIPTNLWRYREHQTWTKGHIIFPQLNTNLKPLFINVYGTRTCAVATTPWGHPLLFRHHCRPRVWFSSLQFYSRHVKQGICIDSKSSLNSHNRLLANTHFLLSFTLLTAHWLHQLFISWKGQVTWKTLLQQQ